MVKKGWVTRSRCTDDRRRVWCKITSSGLALLAELDRPVQDVDDSFREVLDEHELAALIAYLDRIRAHLNQEEG
jgi:DNA-binding MarR family transcriptional regulator